VLGLAARMAQAPAFPDDQLELRRRETLTRIAQDAENTGALAAARFFERAYGAQHPYAHPPRGTAASIASVQRDDLEAFHRARVQPARLVAAVVGDIDPAAACDRVAAALGAWHAEGPQGTDALPSPAFPSSRDTSRIEVPGKAQADIAYGFLGPGRLDDGYYAFWLMNTVLGQYGMGGRLGENIRERQGMAYYASSSYDAHRIPGPLLVRAGVDPANVERTVEAIDFEVARIARDGITADEHANAIRYLAGSIPRMLETNAGVAQFLVTIEQFGLGDDFDRRLPAVLAAVTRDEASAAAATLDPARAVVAVAGP
jgi:zinc protease